MASKHVVRPFNSVCTAKGDRLRYVTDTMDYLNGVENYLHQFMGACLSYVDETIAKELFDAEEALIAPCLSRFRLVPKELPCNIKGGILDVFAKEFGRSPTDIEKAYLTSGFDGEKYSWQNTRELAVRVSGEMGLSLEQFGDLAKTCLLNDMVLNCDAGAGSNNAVSMLFGDGPKSDYSMKAVIASKAADALEAFKPKTLEACRQVVMDVCGYSNPEDLVVAYGKTGSPSAMARFISDKNTGPVDEKVLLSKVKKFRTDAKKQGRKKLIPHLASVRNWLLVATGADVEFYARAWSAAWANSASEINAKFTHNCTFIADKIKALAELDAIEKSTEGLGAAISVLADYMKTVAEDCRYVLAPYHLGDIQTVRNFMAGCTGNFEEVFNGAWENYLEGIDFNQKPPVRELVKFIIEKGGKISSAALGSACKWLSQKDRIDNVYPHPFVQGKQGYTFGPSNIEGAINDPMMQIKSGGIAGERPMMWVTTKLLDNWKWINHHLPFANSRYYEEVYCSKEGLEFKPEARDGKHSFVLGKTIDAFATGRIKTSVGRQKAAKAIERIKANLTHNVIFDPKTTFCLRRKESRFVIAINHRHLLTPMPKEMGIGDRSMGVDQNEGAPTCYAIREKVSEGGILHSDGSRSKVIRMGKVSSIQSGKDVFTYSGVHVEDKANGFDVLWNECREFLAQHGTPEDVAYYQRSREWCKTLYPWHGLYFRMLGKLIRKTKAETLPVFREHLNHVLLKSPLSPVRLHSLSLKSLESTKKVISCISSYFSVCNMKTVEEKEKGDKYLYGVWNKLYASLVERRKERVKLSAGLIIRMCREHGVTFLRVEGDLPTVASGKSRQNNSGKQDWCARELAKRVAEMAVVVGIRCVPVFPQWTSHQDPFVHSKKNKAMRARYTRIEASKFSDRDALALRNIINSKSTGTAEYYRLAVKKFAEKHGLNLLEMKKRKDGLWYRERLSGEVFVPMRGGRVYLSTHRLCSDETYVDGNGEVLYINDADEVAALNVDLVS